MIMFINIRLLLNVLTGSRIAKSGICMKGVFSVGNESSEAYPRRQRLTVDDYIQFDQVAVVLALHHLANIFCQNPLTWLLAL